MQNKEQKLKPTNAIKLASNSESIYKDWLKILKPWNKLTDKEINIAAMFVKSYIENKDNVSDLETLNKLIFSTENKRKIRLAEGLTPTYFQIILRGLRDKNFILENNTLNLQYVPVFDTNNNIILAIILTQ